MLLKKSKGEFFKTVDKEKATSGIGPFNKLVLPGFALAVVKAYHLAVPAPRYSASSP